MSLKKRNLLPVFSRNYLKSKGNPEFPNLKKFKLFDEDGFQKANSTSICSRIFLRKKDM